MTLVQVLADETSVHMSCDFRLTDPYTRVSVQDDAHKLVQVNRFWWSALVGVTGISTIDQIPIGQWMAQITNSETSPEGLFNALRRAEPFLLQISDPVIRRHTFVIAGIRGSQSFVAYVSNYESIDTGRVYRRERANRELRLSITKPKRPRLFLAGDSDTVSAAERNELELALRAGGSASLKQVRMSELNAKVSHRTAARGLQTVSEGCYVASLDATGRGSSRPFLTAEQQRDFVPPEMSETLRQAGLAFRAGTGPDGRPKPIRMVQSASGRINPTAKYFREQLKLQPHNSELWNNYGAWLSAHARSADAIKAFEEAIRLDPKNVMAVANLAKRLWLDRDDEEGAERLYARALAESEPATPTWILSEFANFLARDGGDRQQAAVHHAQAASDDNYPLAKARYGWFVATQDGDLDRAVDLINESLAKAPNSVESLILGARVDCLRKDLDGARSKLERACSLDQNNAEPLLLHAYVIQAQGDPRTAIHYYRRGLRQSRGEWHARGNYGLALLAVGKPQDAVRQLGRAAASLPDDLPIKINLAATLFVLKEEDRALALMRESLTSALPPEHELEVLGMLVIALGASATADLLARFRSLVQSDVHADGTTIRAMSRAQRDPTVRRFGSLLADIAEGKEPIMALPDNTE
jgi:Tfp pilus assembly protein PilF